MGTYRADVIIHIHENLGTDDTEDVQKSLSCEDGVYSACVSDSTRHLMVVDYDPQTTASKTLLDKVTARGLHAEMVGL